MSMWCNSYSDQELELGAIPVEGNGGGRFLPPRGPDMARAQGSPTTPTKSLGLKMPSPLEPRMPSPLAPRMPHPLVPRMPSPLKGKTPLPSTLPELPAKHIPPETTIRATTISSNTHLLPQLRDIRPERMLQLRSEHEGSFNFARISPKDLLMWKSENPELIEDDEFRFEYNSFNERFKIICMPTPAHDSLQCFFNQSLVYSLGGKVGSRANELVQVGSGTTFRGFEGDWTGSSEKLPDAYVWPCDTEFPTVVCEAGWAETHEELREDARLWLLHTGGQTKVVIVLSFSENNANSPLQAANEESEDEEQTVVEGINESTNLNDLVRKLTELNRDRKLRQPLVGSLEATLYVYRATEDSSDITESFRATVLPWPPAETGVPKEFGLTMEDLLGDAVPEDQDPGDLIMFSLEGLQRFVSASIPRTNRIRAFDRAKRLMVEAGVWEEKVTFGQAKREAKRRRLNPPGEKK